ncbi:uncharacterized protein B0H18DRAFT_1062166 [Fomitopsis serialis]|uniref:uncharacterized protein n=1 Tax=Fomitopsis serialis TaxID=139415 RepID=UPI0020074966|nr:uncharacterized protein B0H18DRAFT_1062166 [Neoantrodia serialis]KAH9911505.1 hypothetical protein B0H18DRAFT_1062166 [Neoantrodia serialis]
MNAYGRAVTQPGKDAHGNRTQNIADEPASEGSKREGSRVARADGTQGGKTGRRMGERLAGMRESMVRYPGGYGYGYR